MSHQIARSCRFNLQDLIIRMVAEALPQPGDCRASQSRHDDGRRMFDLIMPRYELHCPVANVLLRQVPDAGPYRTRHGREALIGFMPKEVNALTPNS